MISGNSFNRTQAAALLQAKINALQLKSPELINAFGDFYDSLRLRNLFDDALRHGGDAAVPPQVFVCREADGRLALGVRDLGPGESL